MSTLTEVTERLRRIETKLVVFAEGMGVDTDAGTDWLTLDEPNKVIYLSTLGRSLAVIHALAVKKGAGMTRKDGNRVVYDIVHRGELVGTLEV